MDLENAADEKRLPVRSDPDRDEALAIDTWMATRHGASAGRGFHYQDVVGAWLAASLLAGELDVDRIVPEGNEDLSCEGGDHWQIQVKSRQERVGNFSVREVAGYLAEMWEKRQARLNRASADELLALVLERPVVGFLFNEWSIPLTALGQENDLHSALSRIAIERGWDEGALDELSRVASVFTMTWEAASAQTRERIIGSRDTYPVVADMIGRALRDAIAESADMNASVTTASDSFGVDLSRIVRVADEVIGLVDRDGIEQALSEGICEVVSFDAPLESPDYFEGLAAQPWHIAAGLPAPRPDVVGQVVGGLDRESAVLLVGPSGVGKSTLMWAAVYSLRHVLWYRVRRLDEESVERLIRLARASRPSARSQVGFVVDGVGVGAARAWDQLQREVAATPGVLLLGSVRTEDVFPLRTLPDCVTVNVVLDEAVAERIFQKLRASNRTDAAHWREAYVLADGLTLEYTYLLTRGRRLADVLEEQVKRRVEERRDTELQLIALAATAHRWDGSLSFDLLQDLVGIGTNDLRIALARLNDEHLLRTTGERISGLHPLRSRFLSDSVHKFPPPTLTQTLQKLVANIESDQVGALVAGVLTDRPELEIDILDAVQKRLIADPAPELLATVLDALRTVDFQRSSSAWPEIMDRHNVDPPLRHIAFQLAMLDGDTQLDLKPGMAGAIAELRPNLADASPLGIRFVEQAGPARVSEILAHCSTTNTAVALLSAMSDSRFAVTDFSEAAWTDSNVASLLRNASAVHFGNLIEAARLVDIKLANLFFALGGGEQGAIAKLIQHSPWITDLRIVESESPPVAYMRTMHISDDLQGDPDQSNRDLARTMLRCFPTCGSVDAQALLPGGLPISVGGFELAVSHLQRHYDHSDAEVSWNRRRISIAAAAFGTTNRTERVALAMKILQELAEYFDDLTRVWITSRNRPADVSRLEGLRARLRDHKDLIVPLPASDFSKGLETAALGNDYLHSLVDGLVDNLTNRLVEPGGNMASLAAFAGDSLRKFVTKIELQEEWELLDSAPSTDLARIDETLVDLHAVLSELAHGTTSSRDFTTAARSGRSDGALSRAADVARRAARRRHTRIWEGIRAQLRSAGAIAQIYSRRHVNASATEWPPTQVAIGIEVGAIQEWGTEAVEVIGLLTPGSGGPSYHPGILVVPIVEGRPLRQMCMQIISTALPDADSILSWTTELPPAHETPITDALFEAHKALQELSGLALLSTYREIEQLQSAADEATQRFSMLTPTENRAINAN